MKKQIALWPAIAGLSVALLSAACGSSEQKSAAPEAPAVTAEAIMLEVSSTTFSKIGYDPASQELTVVFRDGGETYTYSGIPAVLFEDMRSAESVGSFYHANIKGKFSETRK